MQVGDGDCGETVAHGSEAILRELDTTYPLNGPASGVMQAVGGSVRQAVGGSSGALYDVALAAAAASLVSVYTLERRAEVGLCTKWPSVQPQPAWCARTCACVCARKLCSVEGIVEECHRLLGRSIGELKISGDVVECATGSWEGSLMS
eukprot:scaffold314050_cov19-Tisochrysis_lutea.AAC.3